MQLHYQSILLSFLHPVSSILCISTKNMFEAHDPIIYLLTPLYMLIFLTQLFPSPLTSARWTLINHYKQHIFSQHSSPSKLKKTLYELARGSGDPVPMFDGSGTRGQQVNLVRQALREMKDGGGAEEGIVTYTLLKQMVAELAIEQL